MALLPFSPPDVLPMKTSSSVAVSPASSVSSTIVSSPLTSASLVGNVSDGPVVQFVLYHPSLFKIEHDFPDVMCIQDVPCNRFFPASVPIGIGGSIHSVPDFAPGWRELILVPIIRKSLYKIFTVLQVPHLDDKIAMIIDALGQGATISDQDIAFSFANFHATRRYLDTVQFKKAMAHLSLSGDDKASMTVFIHLENASYSLFDGMLMNPHVSPYTARTNSALQTMVDQLLQQTIFHSVTMSHSVLSPVSTLPSSASSLAATASPSVEPSWFLSGANSCSFIQAPVMPATVHVPCTNRLVLPLVGMHLRSHDLQSVAGEGVPCNITNASFEQSFCDADMAHVVYRLQGNDASSSNVNVVSMIGCAEATLLVDTEAASSVVDNERKIVDIFSNVVMKKTGNDRNNIVSMIDYAEAALLVDDTKQDGDFSNDAVSMIDHMKKIDNDHNNVVSMVDCAEVASIIDDSKNIDGDLSSIVSTIDTEAASVIDNMEKSDNVFSDVISTINVASS